MMNLVKGLFNSSSPKDKKNETQSFQEFVSVDWRIQGKASAQSHSGSQIGLLNCIAKLYLNHKEILRKDEIEQEKAKQPFRVKQKGYIKKNEYNQSCLDKIKNEDIPKIKGKIEIIQNEINDIKKNPQDYIGNKVGKAGFVTGGIILTFLTVYLFIFYSSASYSAFFKEFKELNELGVAKSIFDAKALSKGLKDGMTELILILTIPFVFLGLGYLIHKFQEGKDWKKYLKISMLIFVTFIFDCILAYEITEKIYNIKAENSFSNIPSYTIAMAFQSVNFWLIIFAGFVVYIVWGFVFDFVMEALGKLDQIRVLINTKQDNIKNHDEQITKLDEEVNKFNHDIGINNIEIEKLKTILDHSDIIKPKELEHSIARFLDGWLEYLSFIEKPETDREKAHEAVTKFIDEKIKPIQILTTEQ